MTVIPFSEVVQGTKPDTEAEKRIQEKEAILQGLFTEQARKEGRPIEDVIAEDRADNNDPKLAVEFGSNPTKGRKVAQDFG